MIVIGALNEFKHVNMGTPTEAYDTLLDGIEGLRKQGYVEDFNLTEQCLECRNGGFRLFHDEFDIDKYFRFEGHSNPSDSSILYAVSSKKTDLKGILVNGYGMYSDDITDELMEKLKC